MSDEDAALRARLEASIEVLWPHIEEGRTEVADLQARLADAERRLNRYLSVANSIAVVLNQPPDELKAAVPQVESTEQAAWVSGTTMRVGARIERPSASDEVPVARVRSTDLVVDLIAAAWPDALTRDEVVQRFVDQGLANAMRDPRNAINTALYRAAKQGRVERIDDDTFRAWPPGDPNQDLTEDERDLL